MSQVIERVSLLSLWETFPYVFYTFKETLFRPVGPPPGTAPLHCQPGRPEQRQLREEEVGLAAVLAVAVLLDEGLRVT